MLEVLLVDDSKFIRKMLRASLPKENFIVTGEASCGLEAIELCKSHKYDVIFLDITMPDMNGVETLKEIKKIDEDANVIMCSAMGQEFFIKESIIAGAKDFIVKPFYAERIRVSLNKLFSLKKNLLSEKFFIKILDK